MGDEFWSVFTRIWGDAGDLIGSERWRLAPRGTAIYCCIRIHKFGSLVLVEAEAEHLRRGPSLTPRRGRCRRGRSGRLADLDARPVEISLALGPLGDHLPLENVLALFVLFSGLVCKVLLIST